MVDLLSALHAVRDLLLFQVQDCASSTLLESSYLWLSSFESGGKGCSTNFRVYIDHLNTLLHTEGLITFHYLLIFKQPFFYVDCFSQICAFYVDAHLLYIARYDGQVQLFMIGKSKF